MYDDFDHDLLAQWCQMYVRFVIGDQQRLAAVVTKCTREQLQRHLLSTSDIAMFSEKNPKTDDDYLAIYAFLCAWDNQFKQKPHPHLLYGVIETSWKGTRYILTHQAEHPIAKAIPETKRFERGEALGTKGVLKLRHHWQAVEFSTEIDIRRSGAFDVFTPSKKYVKIGMSPFAGIDDMEWCHDPTDVRADGSIPFWCDGARNEDALWERLRNVMEAAYQQQVHVLLLPELVMTETLQSALSDWLAQNNAFRPIIRLVIAGTRHVIDANGLNVFSNRCSVFNFIGDIEWEQDKRQPFLMKVKDAGEFFPEIQYPAFEPTQLSLRLVIRNTALGRVAAPICLDFLCDDLWKTMPVDVFFVPAMSSGLSRFVDNCRAAGNSWGSAAFVCNAQPNNGTQAILAYRPTKNDNLESEQNTPFLFTVKVDIDMN